MMKKMIIILTVQLNSLVLLMTMILVTINQKWYLMDGYIISYNNNSSQQYWEERYEEVFEDYEDDYYSHSPVEFLGASYDYDSGDY